MSSRLLIRNLGRASGPLCGLILLVGPAAGASVTPHAAAGTGDLVIASMFKQGSAGAIEQQPGVTYSGSCIWTIDSNEQFGGYGKLDAGASASGGDCLIADSTAHVTYVLVTAASPGLTVSLSYTTEGQAFSETPLATADGYAYQGCVIGPNYDTASAPLVSDSANGGHGVYTVFSINVANTTVHAIRKITVSAGIGSDDPSREAKCRQPISDPFVTANGAMWRIGL